MTQTHPHKKRTRLPAKHQPSSEESAKDATVPAAIIQTHLSDAIVKQTEPQSSIAKLDSVDETALRNTALINEQHNPNAANQASTLPQVPAEQSELSDTSSPQVEAEPFSVLPSID